MITSQEREIVGLIRQTYDLNKESMSRCANLVFHFLEDDFPELDNYVREHGVDEGYLERIASNLIYDGKEPDEKDWIRAICLSKMGLRDSIVTQEEQENATNL